MTIVRLLLYCSCWLVISSTSFALQAGDKAPDFTAISTQGELSLAEILKNGPVVLAF